MSGKFLSKKVIAHYKWAEAVRNSQANREERKRPNHTHIVVCGCDDDGMCHFEADMTAFYNRKE